MLTEMIHHLLPEVVGGGIAYYVHHVIHKFYHTIGRALPALLRLLKKTTTKEDS